MRAPTDGIVASQKPLGWLATRWTRVLDKQTGRKGANRLARGRTLAKGGRVRELWFAPGLANAEVVDTEAFRVSVRVSVFSDAQWQRVLNLLLADLSHIADLLEGRLTPELAAALEAAGLPMLPGPEEVQGDCDCADFVTPCAHVASVHTLLADALEGDPFLLFTLRGRTREQLYSDLRAAWGDPRALVPESEEPAAPADNEDWFGHQTELPRLTFSFRGSEVEAAGLRALGPPPRDADLLRTLTPLYEAGATAAKEVALADGPDGAAPKKRRRKAALAPPATDEDFTERVVDALYEVESASHIELARVLSLGLHEVRRELLELETIGLLVRDIQPDGTTVWMLG